MSTRAMVYVVESLPLRLISVISSSCREVLRSGVIEEDIQFVDKCKQITIIPYNDVATLAQDTLAQIRQAGFHTR